MSDPVLSVTVTNYNYGRFLDQNLRSIRGQTFEDFELIIVDNASTDESLDIIRSHEVEDARVRVVAHTENQGMFASLRESVNLCRGTYRVHVDADDYVLASDAFAVQVESLEAHPSMAFTYSSLVMVDPADQVLWVSHAYDRDVVLPGDRAIEQVLAFTLNHSGTMLRLNSYYATEGYPRRYAHVADMLLAGRLCAVGDVGYLDRQLYAFRKHGGNLHLRPDAHVVRDEILPVIDESLAGFSDRLPDRSVRRRVVRGALVHLPTQYVFGGNPRAGWRLFWESVKVRPYDTVVQWRTLALLGRTVLGRRGYEAIRSRLRPGRNDVAMTRELIDGRNR